MRNESVLRHLAKQDTYETYVKCDTLLKEEKIKYYKGEKTLYSDMIFDQLLRIQEYVEELHPEWKLKDTVTELVGYKEDEINKI